MMKNQIKIILVLLILVSTYSCTSDFGEVDLSQPEQVTAEQNGILVMGYSSTSKGINNTTFLSFPNHDVFEATLSSLEQQTKLHDDQFIAKHDKLTDEQLSDLEQLIGFNLYEPLEKFVSDYGFKDSKLKDYIIAENNWLGKPELDVNNDPDKQFYYLDEEELTVLNKDGVVKIGKSIFKVFDGGHFEITDGNLDALAYLNNLIFNPCDIQLMPIYPNIEIESGCGVGDDDDDGGGNPAVCHSRGDVRSSWGTARRRKMKGEVVLVNSSLWGKKIKSKTKYFKKRFGVWLRRRSNLVAALDGKFDTEESNCGDFTFTFDENIDRKSVHNKSKAKFIRRINPTFQEFKIQSGKVKGVHYEKSNKRTQYLTF